eukprot:scaffold8789_cov51-Phaeocystis_antarctica.AAC.2
MPPSFNFRAAALWPEDLGAPVAFHSRRVLRHISGRQATHAMEQVRALLTTTYYHLLLLTTTDYH